MYVCMNDGMYCTFQQLCLLMYQYILFIGG